MDPLEVIDRLGGDGDAPAVDEVRQARTELAAMLRAAAAETPPDLDAMASLRAAYDAASAAITAAEKEAARAAAEAADLLDGVNETDETDDGEADEASEDTDADADTERSEADAEAEVETVAAAPRRQLLPLSQAFQRVRPLAALAPRPGYSVVTRDGETDGGAFTLSDTAMEFHRSHRNLASGKSVVVSVRSTPDSHLDLRSLDAPAVTRLVDAVAAPEAVTAAGGCCSLAEPLFEQPMLSSTARPIRASLPVFNADARGKVSYYPPVCLPQDGVGIWTCDDDAAVDPADPSTWKECADVDCFTEPPPAVVEAIYHCLNIGVWQRRFAPERWAAVLRALMAQQARLAETRLFDLMVTRATTDHTVANEGGFLSTFFDGVGRAAAQIRQDQRYEGVQLRLVLAEWVRDALRDDAFRWGPGDGIKGLANAQIEAWLAQYGVQAVWSPDIDPIFPESPGQVDGPLADYPTTADAVLFAEGDHVLVDGGEYNLGTEIVDVANARQNQVTAFAETFETLLTRSCNSKALHFEVVTSGACCVSA